MRLLLVIMTGIGFTLGLLCGLLLHLPADGLPARVSPHLVPDLQGSADYKTRAKRSVHDPASIVMTDDVARNGPPSSNGGQSGSNVVSRFALKSLQESPPNPEVDGSPAVSRERDANNEDPLLAEQRARQAEPIVVTGEERRDDGGTERGKENNPGPAVIRPVTSYTLRLRNAGGKFVVDSAVQRIVDEAGRVVSVQDNNDEGRVPQHRLHTDSAVPSGSGNSSLKDIVDGVLWSSRLEASCPQGVQQLHDVASWRRKTAGMEVVRMEEGCGRMQNRLLTFKDGSQACGRYRLNTDQIQGEVYSYYLAKLLHIPNLPPAILLPVDSLSPQWRPIHLQMSLAQWADGRLVVLTRWLEDLAHAHIPVELREDDRRLSPALDVLGKKTLPELCELLQWSDLIVFDYLTANLDRVVNNMFNRQWNPEMMNNAAHNLERTRAGSLVFLDNESGLFHGYRLLEKYQGYHEALLDALCVFRESTVRAVRRLVKSVGEDLRRVLEEGEVHHRHLPPMPEKNVQVLRDRLARVVQQVERCQTLYGRR